MDENNLGEVKSPCSPLPLCLLFIVLDGGRFLTVDLCQRLIKQKQPFADVLQNRCS